jgi:hypothetical protein
VLLPWNAGAPFHGGLDRPETRGVLYELQSGAHSIGRGGVTANSNEMIVPNPLSCRRAAS